MQEGFKRLKYSGEVYSNSTLGKMAKSGEYQNSKMLCYWAFILMLVIRELAGKKGRIYLGIFDYFQPIT